MGFKLTVQHVEDTTLPDDSIHQAKVVDFNLRDFNTTDKQGNPVLRQYLDFFFEITASGDDRFVGRKVKGSVPFVLTDGDYNKYRAWAEVLLGRPIPEGLEIDTDDLQGLSCEIVINQTPGKNGGRPFETVSDILPLSGSYSDNPPF